MLAVDESTILANWTRPGRTDGIAAFVVQAMNGASMRECLRDTSSNWCSISGLKSSTMYQVSVKSCGVSPTDSTPVCSRQLVFSVKTPDHSELVAAQFGCLEYD